MIRVFDTGALVGIERRDARILHVHRRAIMDQQTVIVPIAVVGEWWRGRTDWRETILASMTVEPLDLATAKAAGEALAETKPRKGRTISLVDAIVMATAARVARSREVAVYTSDFDDLVRLQAFFPSVRVLSVTRAS